MSAAAVPSPVAFLLFLLGFLLFLGGEREGGEGVQSGAERAALIEDRTFLEEQISLHNSHRT